MESKNLNLILDKRITKAWRGYGFFISFEFGSNEEIPDVSLNIDSAWAFVKDGEDLIGTDADKDEAILLEEIDQFLDENFKPKTVEVDAIEHQNDITIIFFSNGLELEMNNGSEDGDDDWYLLSK